MITRRDLDEAIDDLSGKNLTMEGCVKLASLYTLREYMYGEPPPATYGDAPPASGSVEDVIGQYGETEFLKVIAGKPSSDVWAVMSEAMESLRVMEPRLYAGIIRKLQK